MDGFKRKVKVPTFSTTKSWVIVRNTYSFYVFADRLYIYHRLGYRLYVHCIHSGKNVIIGFFKLKHKK